MSDPVKTRPTNDDKMRAIERLLIATDDDGCNQFAVTTDMLDVALAHLPPGYGSGECELTGPKRAGSNKCVIDFDSSALVGRVFFGWSDGSADALRGWKAYVSRDAELLSTWGGEEGLTAAWAAMKTPSIEETQADIVCLLELAVESWRHAKKLKRSYVGRRVSDVASKPVKWLWEDRIARGKVTLIGGPPKRGKSQLTCALAAPITTGGMFPDGSDAPFGSVAFITCEDDLADTIRPRLEAAGADVSKVHVFDLAKVKGKDGKLHAQPFNVAEHMPQLREFVADIGDLRLLIIDPILAYMGRTDSHKTSDVRGAMLGLQQLVAERDIAAVLITHLNKNDGAQGAMNRMAASGAFTAVARGVWLVDFDPADVNRQRRLFIPIGANIGNDRDGFAFGIETVALGNGIVTSKVVFEPETVMADADEVTAPRDPALQGAREFLQAELADGPVPIRELNKAAREAGINLKTLSRAARKIGAKRVPHEGKACWQLDPRKIRALSGSVLDGTSDPSALFG